MRSASQGGVHREFAATEDQPRDDDAERELHARLTDKGLEVLRKIWPVYRARIANYFGAHLREADAKQIAPVFGRVVAAAEPSKQACDKVSDLPLSAMD